MEKEMRKIYEFIRAYGSWRPENHFPTIYLALEPLSLPYDLKEELERIGNLLFEFFKAGNELYKSFPEVRNLVKTGKPRWWLKIEEELFFKDSSKQLPYIYRPDVLLTENGLKITEIEVAVEGLGFEGVWNLAYGQNQYSLQMFKDEIKRGISFLDLTPPDNIHETETIVRLLKEMGIKAQLLPLRELTGKEEGVVFRPFNLARWTADPNFSEEAAFRFSLSPRVKPLNPTSWFEEKAWMGILFHPRYEKFLRNYLGLAFDTLKEYICRTWILDPEFMTQIFLKELWEGREPKLRKYVSKLSGFNLRAWGSRSVVRWDEKPLADWHELLWESGARNYSIDILQEYQEAEGLSMSVWNLTKNRKEEREFKVLLRPFYLAGKYCGATSVLRNSWKIHGASDTVVCPIKWV